MEDQLAEAHRDANNLGEGGAQNLHDIDESRDATILIDITGTILFANKACCALFGHKKTDLEGNNISMCMPPPFSTSHNFYLRNYAATGKSNVIGATRELVALHKQKNVFPISLYVRKVVQGGNDAFMGVITPQVSLIQYGLQRRIFRANHHMTFYASPSLSHTHSYVHKGI